jgi:hypothetical protein
MEIGLLFWVIYIISIVFGLWAGSQPPLARWAGWPMFICTGLLGWQVFGAAVHK